MNSDRLPFLGRRLLCVLFCSVLLSSCLVLSAWADDAEGEQGEDPAPQAQGGWVTGEDGLIRYYDAEGALVTGWLQLDGSWYYLSEDDGARADDGLLDVDGTTYWFGEDGVMASAEWLDIDGSRYYFAKLGRMLKSEWHMTDGVWYYLCYDGKMATTRWVKTNGEWYYVDDEGRMETQSWVKTDGDWYYVKKTGKMAHGEWYQSGQGKWYYLNTDGCMLYGSWNKIDGSWYRFAPEGYVHTSAWYKDAKGVYYYLTSTGRMATGWFKVGSTWYYAKGSGAWVPLSGRYALDKALMSIINNHTGYNLRNMYYWVAYNYSYREQTLYPDWSGWYADYAYSMVSNGSGNCYAYSCLFYYLARAAGYDCTVVSGKYVERGGSLGAHCWTECVINGKTYVMDPEATYQGIAGYMVTYGNAGLTYVK